MPNLVHIRPWGVLGNWVKYNQIIFIYALCGNSPTGQTRRRIFAHDGSNDADSRKDVPFLSVVDIAPHLGGKISKYPNFGGVNRRFQAKLVKSKNIHIIKTTASIPTTKFCTAIKTIKCPSWVVRTHTTNPRWRTAAILEKSKNRHISAAVWPMSTKFGTVTQFDPF